MRLFLFMLLLCPAVYGMETEVELQEFKSYNWSGYMFRCTGKDSFELLSAKNQLTLQDVEYYKRAIAFLCPDFERCLDHAGHEVLIPALIIGTKDESVIPFLRAALDALVTHRPNARQFYYVTLQSNHQTPA